MAFIGSTSISTCVSPEMAANVRENYEQSAFWMKLTGAQMPNMSKLENGEKFCGGSKLMIIIKC
jgi:hypothetical protein